MVAIQQLRSRKEGHHVEADDRYFSGRNCCRSDDVGGWVPSHSHKCGSDFERGRGGRRVTRYGITREDARIIEESVPNIDTVVPVREVKSKARRAGTDARVTTKSLWSWMARTHDSA